MLTVAHQVLYSSIDQDTNTILNDRNQQVRSLVHDVGVEQELLVNVHVARLKVDRRRRSKFCMCVGMGQESKPKSTCLSQVNLIAGKLRPIQ